MTSEQRLAARAHRAVKNAVRDGILIRPNTCMQCGRIPGDSRNGKPLIQGHHHNGYEYDHWLDVVWLCPSCHMLADVSQETRNKLSAIVTKWWEDHPEQRLRLSEQSKRVMAGFRHRPESKAKIRASTVRQYAKLHDEGVPSTFMKLCERCGRPVHVRWMNKHVCAGV